MKSAVKATRLGGDGLAYGFWLDRVHPGADALIVADQRQPLRDAAVRLEAHCAAVRELPPVTVHRGDRPVTTFRMWSCRRWHARPELAARQPLPASGGAR